MDREATSVQVKPVSGALAGAVVHQLRQGELLPPEATPSRREPTLWNVSLPVSGEYLSLRTTAGFLKHSYFWLSRNYRRLGLRPSRIGGKLLFERRELIVLMNRSKVRAPGRPRASREWNF